MKERKKHLAILGSTGSIGVQTLDVVRNHPDKFEVVALAADRNTGLLNRQISEFQPQFVYSTGFSDLPDTVHHRSMEEISVETSVDIVIIATTGRAGLNPTLAAIKAGKNVAIANKEVLVMAGKIITLEAKKHNTQILPIDSEHSAIWQCLRGENDAIKRLILTASGGPFYGYNAERLSEVTLEETLNHPTWKMGKKVTVDSATLMNKGLEIIEARWLFDIPIEMVDIVIHRNSIIHSMVEFIDGSIKAQLSYPDMRLPIQFALSSPERLKSVNLPSLDLTKTGALIFEPVKYGDYPCLTLAIEAGKRGDTYPAVLCAADEIAVGFFLEKKIKFNSIPVIIDGVIEAHKIIAEPRLEDILEADRWARETAREIIDKRSLCYY